MFHYDLRRITDTLHEGRYMYICVVCLSELFSEREAFRTDVLQNTKTHTHFTFNDFFRKLCRL